MKEPQKKQEWWYIWLIVLGTTLLALLASKSVIYDFSSLEVFAPIEKKVDFRLSDIYNTVEQYRSTQTLSRDIVVVSVDNCDREQTLDVIHKISDCKPKAIGLDISFAVPKDEESNAYLLETLLFTPNLVSASMVKKTDSIYRLEPLSFYDLDEDFEPEHTGYVNLDATHPWNVIRTFIPYVCLEGGDTLPSMPLALAQIASPERAQQLIDRANPTEIIDFTSCEIEIITSEKLDYTAVSKRLRNKIVLIGDTADQKDIYLTPLHDPTPGVMIHAYTLQTILNGRYIRSTPLFHNWLMATIICILFTGVLLFTRNHVNHLGSLLIRLSQFLIMYGLVWLGCLIFSIRHVYTDFAPSILMLGLGTFTLDIVNAILGICQDIINWFTNKKNEQ